MKPLTKPGRITLRIEAYTDPAGKYDESAPLNGNEDNFFVSDHGDAEGVVTTPQYGVLIAVADGMGGLNAGEVASGIAIDTVKKSFTPKKLAAMASHNGPTRQMFLERIIREADAQIKEVQRHNPTKAEMGSTIILAWLMGNELVVSWCGDSRAYLYNSSDGLRLISRDHSYVQKLVDSGAITYEQAFDHPQNNIVTRSLGDPEHAAKPESRRLIMGRGDILMVCSDGLSGVLRDKKSYDVKGNLLPEMNMEDIFRASTSLKECRTALWEAAEKSGWYDNVTAVLCEMVEGPVVTPESEVNTNNNAGSVLPTPPSVGSVQSTPASGGHNKSKLWIEIVLVAVAVIVAIAVFANRYIFNDTPKPEKAQEELIYFNQDEGEPTNYGSETPLDSRKDRKDSPREATPENKNQKQVEEKNTEIPAEVSESETPPTTDKKSNWEKKPAKKEQNTSKEPIENTHE